MATKSKMATCWKLVEELFGKLYGTGTSSKNTEWKDYHEKLIDGYGFAVAQIEQLEKSMI
jgi:hypothetical protein